MGNFSELFKITTIPSKVLTKWNQFPLYTVIYLPEGRGMYQSDSGVYQFQGPAIFFMTPFQKFRIKLPPQGKPVMLQFHGDFYCIELHKKEVACNGLLFNNIFVSPHIDLSPQDAQKLEDLFQQMKKEEREYDPSVMTAYLQLLLALCSRIKKRDLQEESETQVLDPKMNRFKEILEDHYLTLHRPGDYAQILKIDSNSLSKRCKKTFGKSPSQLIHERLVLEAKKLLHLTRHSVKEVAFKLHFKDEHYFSRFFKKSTGLSPQKYRQKTGISIVADLSKE